MTFYIIFYIGWYVILANYLDNPYTIASITAYLLGLGMGHIFINYCKSWNLWLRKN